MRSQSLLYLAHACRSPTALLLARPRSCGLGRAALVVGHSLCGASYVVPIIARPTSYTHCSSCKTVARRLLYNCRGFVFVVARCSPCRLRCGFRLKVFIVRCLCRCRSSCGFRAAATFGRWPQRSACCAVFVLRGMPIVQRRPCNLCRAVFVVIARSSSCGARLAVLVVWHSSCCVFSSALAAQCSACGHWRCGLCRLALVVPQLAVFFVVQCSSCGVFARCPALCGIRFPALPSP